MTYKERLDKLDNKLNINHELIKEVQDIDLTFDFAGQNTINEFSSFIRQMMKEYEIGQKVSKRFWGIRGYKDIQSTLYDALQKQVTRQRPLSQLDLFDNLRDDVDGKKTKDYTNYHFARVARTEGKAMTTIYQLQKFKEAGLKYVKHVTRSDNKVSRECAIHNGREDKIDWLLSKQGENIRPPRHPNCRCRVTASMRGV